MGFFEDRGRHSKKKNKMSSDMDQNVALSFACMTSRIGYASVRAGLRHRPTRPWPRAPGF